MNVQYSIIEGKNKQINAFRKEVNQYIKEKKIDGELTDKQAVELIKVNNKLARANKANTMWFIGGVVTGVLIETIVIIGVTSIK